jgi:D-alanyl-D-alanine dipeptidase
MRTLLLLGLWVCCVGCVHDERRVEAPARQLLVVLTDGWDTPIGAAHLYEGAPGAWRELVGGPVVVGRNGLGWGRGLGEGLSPGEGQPVKQEGDGRAPAGVFSLGAAFGNSPPGGAWPFRALTANTECVDDVASTHYAQTVERDAVSVDWKSSEAMASQPLYRVGAFVEHNTRDLKVGAGSCIFLHVWRAPDHGTAGCTAFDELVLRQVLTQLRPDAKPVLIQLPKAVYVAQRATHGWP